MYNLTIAQVAYDVARTVCPLDSGIGTASSYTITDTSKSWEVNQWAGGSLFFGSPVSWSTVTTNTANTITSSETNSGTGAYTVTTNKVSPGIILQGVTSALRNPNVGNTGSKPYDISNLNEPIAGVENYELLSWLAVLNTLRLFLVITGNDEPVMKELFNEASTRVQALSSSPHTFTAGRLLGL